MFQKYKMEIEKITQETSDSKSFILVPKDSSEGLFNYLPGQFFLLEAEITRPKTFAYDKRKRMMAGSGELVKTIDKKAFSIVSSPTDEGYIELLVKSEKGMFVPYFLEQTQVGDICTIQGPQGNFMNKIFQNSEKMIACWSAGSGIPSTISLMKFAIYKGFDLRIFVFDSNKTVDDIIHHERIKKLVGESEKFNAIFTLTSFTKDLPKNNGNIKYAGGRFWAEGENTLEKYSGGDWKGYFNTICGSSSFINGKSRDKNGVLTKLGKGVEDHLLEFGIPQNNIDKDQFYLQ